MQRAVEERERRPLARASQRRAFGQPPAPFDVGRGERAQRARHFRERQIGEMSRLERLDPPMEMFVGQSEAGPKGPTSMMLQAGRGDHLDFDPSFAPIGDPAADLHSMSEVLGEVLIADERVSRGTGPVGQHIAPPGVRSTHPLTVISLPSLTWTFVLLTSSFRRMRRSCLSISAAERFCSSISAVRQNVIVPTIEDDYFR